MQKIGLSREDYIKYKEHFFKVLEKIEIQEQEEAEKSVNQKHDKSFKDILIEKEEMAKFLQQFVGIQVESEELEEQKNSYINKQFEKRESDIIYKIKEKDIYIIVEHQSRVDPKMPRRILEYCIGIMTAIEKNRRQNDRTNPIIIPVVLYTGNERWTVATNFSDTQKSYQGYENYKINLNYKLIDINKYTCQELLDSKTKLAYMMLLEKCRTRKQLIEQIVEIIVRAENKETIEWIKQMIKYVFPEMLREDKNKILRMLEKGEKSDMQDLIERIKENEARNEKKLRAEGREEGRVLGRKAGIIETIANVIKNMLQQNESEEKIMKYTNATREDIEKVKRQLCI